MASQSSSFLEIPWRWILTKSETLQSIMNQSSLSIHDRLYGMSHSLALGASVVSYHRFAPILTMFLYATPKVSPQLGPPSLIYFFTKNNPCLFTYQRNATRPHRSARWSVGALSRIHPMVATWPLHDRRCFYGALGRVEGMTGRYMSHRSIIIFGSRNTMYSIVFMRQVIKSPTHAGLTEWSTRTLRWTRGIADNS